MLTENNIGTVGTRTATITGRAIFDGPLAEQGGGADTSERGLAKSRSPGEEQLLGKFSRRDGTLQRDLGMPLAHHIGETVWTIPSGDRTSLTV
jgi:hypothetical protein